LAGVRRALTLAAAAALAIALPVPRATAATNSLADAQAAITAAQAAANRAASAYNDAESRYYELQNAITATKSTVSMLQGTRDHLSDIVRERARVLYMQGGTPDFDLFSATDDALDIARRTTLGAAANAGAEAAMAQLQAASEDLDAHETELHAQLDDAKQTLDDLRTQQVALQDAFNRAVQAEQDLRVRLEQQQRADEYANLVRQARDNAGSPPSTGGTGTPPVVDNPGQVIASGDWVCPVQGAVSFTDTFGAPRGDHTHQGVDMFAALGTPIVAVVSGSMFFQGDPNGGLASYVTGSDGTTYYYAHLNDYVGGNRSVAAGELIGHVGNTGDAAGGPTHLHFEIRPGGPNGLAIDPTPTVAAHC
jgi:murein DD-endopeptidase MepM/ murein hydrolase activator NlpD